MKGLGGGSVDEPLAVELIQDLLPLLRREGEVGVLVGAGAGGLTDR